MAAYIAPLLEKLSNESDDQEKRCGGLDFKGNDQYLDFISYSEHMKHLNFCSGIVNSLICAVMLGYAIFTCVRKHRLTRNVWVALSLLFAAILITAYGQLEYNSITF